MAAPRPSPVRIVVRSRRRLFREALAAYLDAQSGYDVVGHTSRLDDLARLCALCQPDVVLVDLGGDATLAGPPRVDSWGDMRVPWARTVVLYDDVSPPDVDALWRLGVTAMVPCSHGLAALMIVLGRGAEGAADRSDRPGLTDREQEILALMGSGHTVDRVAALLGLTPGAVSSAKRRIYQKMQVFSQSQAVALASTLGLSGAGPAVVATPALPELTRRESDILRSIAQGHTVRQTARQLGVAHKTVENTQARLFGKLRVRNRSAALSAAYTLGLIEADDPADANPPGPAEPDASH